MKGPKIPAVIPPAFTPQQPAGSGPSASTGQTAMGFTGSGTQASLQGPARGRKKSLIGGAA